MKYLVLQVREDVSDEIIQSYAELVLDTADNDEVFSGVPSPFYENYFVGDIKELGVKV